MISCRGFFLPFLLFINYSSKDLQIIQVVWRPRLGSLAGTNNSIQVNRNNGQSQWKLCGQEFIQYRLRKNSTAFWHHSAYSLSFFSVRLMALLVGDQDRYRRPMAPFVSPCVNQEQLHYLSHAVLFTKSVHCGLLNAAGCWSFLSKLGFCAT